MGAYSKFIGAIIGGVIGLVLVKIGLSDAAGVPATYQPFVDALTAAATSALGTFFAPKNEVK